MQQQLSLSLSPFRLRTRCLLPREPCRVQIQGLHLSEWPKTPSRPRSQCRLISDRLWSSTCTRQRSSTPGLRISWGWCKCWLDSLLPSRPPHLPSPLQLSRRMRHLGWARTQVIWLWGLGFIELVIRWDLRINNSVQYGLCSNLYHQELPSRDSCI